MQSNLVRSCTLLLGLALASACGGGGDGGTGNEDPVFTSLSVSPTTLSVAVGETKAPLTVTPRDQANRAMTGLPAATFTSSNNNRATVSGAGAVTGVSAGTSTITASVTHGGLTRTGTSAITVTAPDGPPPPTAAVQATINSTFNPDSVRVAQNGTVNWTFAALEHNVVFNTVAGRPSDIPPTTNATVGKTFGTVGTYPYRCTIHPGMDGKVVVQAP